MVAGNGATVAPNDRAVALNGDTFGGNGLNVAPNKAVVAQLYA